MLKQMSIALIIVGLVFGVSSISFAQDTQQKVEKEAKKEMKADAVKKEAQALKSISCAPECGFMVRSHDEGELASIVMTHAKKVHGKEMTEKETKALMKDEKLEVTSAEKKVEKKVEKK